MKHWFFYIRIPADVVKDTPFFTAWLGGNTVERLSIESPRDTSLRGDFEGLEVMETDEGNVLYGLYAWTTADDTAKLFKESRNPKYFFCKKMDIPINTYDWEALRAQYKSYEIIRTSYSDDDNNNYHIPMTHFESDTLFDEDNQNLVIQTIVEQMLVERSMKRKTDNDFRVVIDILDQTLLETLDLLSWSELIVEYGLVDADICKLGMSDRDPDYLVDDYYESASYNLGLSGREVAIRELEPVNVYIYMLGDLLK